MMSSIYGSAISSRLSIKAKPSFLFAMANEVAFKVATVEKAARKLRTRRSCARLMRCRQVNFVFEDQEANLSNNLSSRSPKVFWGAKKKTFEISLACRKRKNYSHQTPSVAKAPKNSYITREIKIILNNFMVTGHDSKQKIQFSLRLRNIFSAKHFSTFCCALEHSYWLTALKWSSFVNHRIRKSPLMGRWCGGVGIIFQFPRAVLWKLGAVNLAYL